MTHYEVFGVYPNATYAELKEKHRELVKRYHTGGELEKGDADKFRQIREAWKILSDSRKREEYDRQLLLETTMNVAETSKLIASEFIDQFR